MKRQKIAAITVLIVLEIAIVIGVGMGYLYGFASFVVVIAATVVAVVLNGIVAGKGSRCEKCGEVPGTERLTLISGRVVSLCMDCEKEILAVREKPASLLQMVFKVVFVCGAGTLKNYYDVFEGTEQECEGYIASLPSNESWENAWESTNPFQEACHVEEVEWEVA